MPALSRLVMGPRVGGADTRIAALRRFAFMNTALTIAGAFLLGFEDSWAQPVVALAVAYTLELGLERLDAWSNRRPPRYAGGPRALVDFLLPAHLTGLGVALLLYPGARLMPIVFAVTVGIASKHVFRVRLNGSRRHFFNPSNVGISVTLLTFPAVGVVPPYHFTETVAGALDWIVPAGVLIAGTLLNSRLTGREPLILAFVGGFVAQALLRAALFDAPVLSGLLPLTGVIVILYINFMITDPGTTPSRWPAQVAFGASTAAVYGILVLAHVEFGLFFALTIVSALRGMGLALAARRAAQPANGAAHRSPDGPEARGVMTAGYSTRVARGLEQPHRPRATPTTENIGQTLRAGPLILSDRISRLPSWSSAGLAPRPSTGSLVNALATSSNIAACASSGTLPQALRPAPILGWSTSAMTPTELLWR